MRITNLLLLTGLLIGNAAPAAAQAGAYDLSFGTNGAVTRLAFPRQHTLHLDHQGRLLVVGAGYGGTYPEAQRLLPNGDRDPSFNGGQHIQIHVIDAWAAEDVDVDSTDRPVFAFAMDQGSYSGVARFTEDGVLDASFGTEGVVLFDSLAAYDGLQVALAKDGLVYLAATDTLHTALRIARLRPNGQIDGSYGTHGVLRIPLPSPHVGGLLAEEEGGLVLAGSFGGPTSRDLFVLRLNADGSPDVSFGTGGLYTRDYTMGEEDMKVLERDPSGGYITGGFGEKEGVQEALVLRLQADGTPLATFGDEGFVLFRFADIDYPSWVTGLRVMDDGRVRLGGHLGFFRVGLAGLLADGSFDSSFAGGGRVVYGGAQFNHIGLSTYPTLVTDDRIYASGDGYPQNNSNHYGWVVAFKNETTVAAEPEPVDGGLAARVRPNPASGAFAVDLHLEQAGDVHVRLFDVLGRCVAERPAALLAAGDHELPVDLTGVAPGTYVVRTATAAGVATRLLTVR